MRLDKRLDRAYQAVAKLELIDAMFKTCPWESRDLIKTGLRQWLRCCAAALHDGQMIGMPSRAVDEVWHGLILCTARYQAFCNAAYGQFMHHHPVGGAPDDIAAAADPMDEQLRRTVIAWELVAMPGESCVLWNLDDRVGVEEPCVINVARITEIQEAVTEIRVGVRN